MHSQIDKIDVAIVRSGVRISEIYVCILSITKVARSAVQREFGVVKARASELSDRVTALDARLLKGDTADRPARY